MRLQHRCFPANWRKFLRAPFFIEHFVVYFLIPKFDFKEKKWFHDKLKSTCNFTFRLQTSVTSVKLSESRSCTVSIHNFHQRFLSPFKSKKEFKSKPTLHRSLLYTDVNFCFSLFYIHKKIYSLMTLWLVIAVTGKKKDEKVKNDK